MFKNYQLLTRLGRYKKLEIITVDQNLIPQQKLTNINLIIIVLVAKDNRFTTLKPLITKVNKILENLKKVMLFLSNN